MSAATNWKLPEEQCFECGEGAIASSSEFLNGIWIQITNDISKYFKTSTIPANHDFQKDEIYLYVSLVEFFILEIIKHVENIKNVAQRDKIINIIKRLLTIYKPEIKDQILRSRMLRIYKYENTNQTLRNRAKHATDYEISIYIPIQLILEI